MSDNDELTLDVREELRRGGEPLSRILHAVGELAPGQRLRLLATFEPLPLYTLLGKKGFGHQSRQIGPGDWEVVFSPADAAAGQRPAERTPTPRAGSHAGTDTSQWPSPSTHLDNRGLSPPEPLVRILEALEQLPAGAVLEAINEREPVFLYPQLEQRKAQIRTETQSDGSVRLLIRRGAQA